MVSAWKYNVAKNKTSNSTNEMATMGNEIFLTKKFYFINYIKIQIKMKVKGILLKEKFTREEKELST